MSTLYLCAASNPEAVRLALEVNEASGRWARIVLLDDDPALHGRDVLGVPVLGPFDALAGHRRGDEAVNLVARSTKGRDGARARIEGHGIALASLVHPSINLRGATLGRAVTLYEGCVISALSRVGDHAVVFARGVLGHGASLGEGAVLGPGAVVNARVCVGARAYIGTNAAVLPDLAIGADATVSACSAVVGDVPPGCTALGVPAEIMGGGGHIVGDAGGVQAASVDTVQAVFAEVLGLPSIGSEANFFHAGGNSKLALELHRRLGQRLGLPLAVVDIFRFPSPGALAAHVFGAAGQAGAQTLTPSRAEIIRRRRDRRA